MEEGEEGVDTTRRGRRRRKETIHLEGKEVEECVDTTRKGRKWWKKLIQLGGRGGGGRSRYN